jgi:hypothetical protein
MRWHFGWDILWLMGEKIPQQAPVKDLYEVVKEYGSLDDPRLTDEKLLAMGYTRLGPGRVVQTSLVSSIEAKANRKSEHIPFDEISFSASRARRGRIKVPMEKIEELLDPLPVYGTDSVIEDVVYRDLMSALKFFEASLGTPEARTRLGAKEGDIHYSTAIEDVINQPIKRLVNHSTVNIPEFEAFEKRLEGVDGDGYVLDAGGNPDIDATEAWCEEAFNDLERAKGKLADPDHHKAEFEEYMAQALDRKEFEHLNEFELSEEAGETEFELARFVFATAFECGGMAEITPAIRGANSIAEMQKLGGIELPSVAEERTIRARMKGASVEEKKELSQALSSLKEKRKEEQKALLFVSAYFSLPARWAKVMQSIINGLQDQLTTGGASAEELTFSLRGTPDSDLDRDPGAISGDCTEGKPLPFSDSRFLLYNVKVFDGEQQHIGNMYLYETVLDKMEHKERGTVWHLDAIQIPANIGWTQAVESLMENLSEAARKKNIGYISVSRTAEHISNYNYVANAVLEFVKSIGAEKGTIDVEVMGSRGDDTISSLQTDGRVWLIPTGTRSSE